MSTARVDLFSSFTEGLAVNDGFTRAWLTQVVLRMRRELTWLWRHHEPVDRLADALERQSLAAQRLRFFAEDPSARHLDERIRDLQLPLRGRGGRRGSLAWLVRDLDLPRAEIFVVALALAAARDAAAGELIAALHGDARRLLPTLGLAQRLWDEPQALAPLVSAAHPLFARGVLRRTEDTSEWAAPFFMPSLVARILEGRLPRHSLPELECIADPAEPAQAGWQSPTQADRDAELELLASRMAQTPEGLHVVPVSVAFAAGALEAKRASPTLRRLAAFTGRPVYTLRANVAPSAAALDTAGVCCWLQGADLLLASPGFPADSSWQNSLRPFPLYVFAAAQDEAAAPRAQVLPTLTIAAPGYAERHAAWQSELGLHGLEADADAVRECAYRFRLDAAAIADVVGTLSRTLAPLTLERMARACQQQTGLPIGAQATRVAPRFRRGELVLDAERGQQFDQLLAAMRSLSRVHADWGTGKAWGDAGISALFAGPSGTGKTMAAEVIAAELHLPLYHVDLSQVVNKYIGETEKNLRRLFDAAEQADVVLFFDEADSLFGQRTQTRNANDRFANMEISYLLERMDRFRGLAILATNRRKDLDEAFLRRLRYVIEFPLPSEAERLAIWKKCIPAEVSASGIDFGFLAHEFALPGGNIRSIVLNACLQSASAQRAPALSMAIVMNAIDREYEKIGRPLTREQKAQWRPMSAGVNAGAPAATPARAGALP